ncbi:hypothetical protein, partial [Sediminibacillus albus]
HLAPKELPSPNSDKSTSSLRSVFPLSQSGKSTAYGADQGAFAFDLIIRFFGFLIPNIKGNVTRYFSSLQCLKKAM